MCVSGGHACVSAGEMRVSAGRRGRGRSTDDYLAIKIDASQIYCSSLKQPASTWLRKTWHICSPEFPKGFAEVQQGLLKKLSGLRKVPPTQVLLGGQEKDRRDKGSGFRVKDLFLGLCRSMYSTHLQSREKTKVAKVANENKGLAMLQPRSCRWSFFCRMTAGGNAEGILRKCLLNAGDGENNCISVRTAGLGADFPNGNILGSGQTFEKLSSGISSSQENKLNVQRYGQGAWEDTAVSVQWGSPTWKGNNFQ